jgi:hypothetical protein
MAQEQHPNRWEELASEKPASPSLPSTPLTVRLTHGAWFGIAMGIGFAIGFLISLLLLIAFVGFVIYSRFPGLFG